MKSKSIMKSKRIILTIVLIMVCDRIFVQPAKADKSGDADPKDSRGWKWDVSIYDRPGWNSFTFQFPLWGAIEKKENIMSQHERFGLDTGVVWSSCIPPS